MSKKERVKGKGADIFFSEDQTDFTSEQQSEELATKATFYFTQSQLDALEKAVFLLKQEYRIKTNKSEVMRIALDEIIKEFEENQKDSALFLRLAG
jgi:hypothetical protein